MNRAARRDCDGCRLTLAQTCGVGRSVRLCGLCRLLPPDALRRYAERWRPVEALAVADDAGAGA